MLPNFTDPTLNLPVAHPIQCQNGHFSEQSAVLARTAYLRGYICSHCGDQIPNYLREEANARDYREFFKNEIDPTDTIDYDNLCQQIATKVSQRFKTLAPYIDPTTNTFITTPIQCKSCNKISDNEAIWYRFSITNFNTCSHCLHEINPQENAELTETYRQFYNNTVFPFIKIDYDNYILLVRNKINYCLNNHLSHE